MIVTPTKKKFGKYAPGDTFELRDKTAKVLVKLGMLAPAQAAPAAGGYQTRMLTAAPVAPLVAAPAPQAPVGQYIIKVEGADTVLDHMEKDDLHALAKALGVEVHHALGASRLREELVKAQASE